MTDPRTLPAEQIDDAEAWEAGFTIRDLVTAVRRRWWAVLAVFIVVVAIGIWRTVNQPRLYEASVTVRIQEGQSPLPGVQAPGATMDWRVDRLLSEQQVIKSQIVGERVAKALGLRVAVSGSKKVRFSSIFDSIPPKIIGEPSVTEYRLALGRNDYALTGGGTRYGPVPYGRVLDAGGLVLQLMHRPNVDDDEVTLSIMPLAAAAGGVRGGVSTRVVPQTDIVEITYQGGDPKLVRDIANTVATSYASFSSETQKSSARGKSEFIMEQLKKQEKLLFEAQEQIKRFQGANQTSDVTSEAAALFANIHTLEADRRAALVEQKVYLTLIGNLQPADTLDEQLRRLVGTDAGARNQAIADLYGQWFQLVKEREALLVKYDPNHPDVQAFDRLITRTKRDLQTASRVYLQALASKLESLERTIAELRAQAERYPPLQAEQGRLLSNMQTIKTLYDELQSQYQLARISESADGGTVRIIDEATMPTYAVAPNRKRAATMSMILGLLLGIGLAVLLEKLDNSVKTPDEIRDRLDLTVLGMIPGIKLSEDVDLRATPAIGRLVTHADPRSPVAEAYRSLRTNLAFARAHTDLRTLVLTSPGPADGKSTTIANLAITFAQQGQRTLVVDADLRRAVLDKTFSVPRSPGLTDVILGTTSLRDAVNASEVPNLSVLGSGHFPPNPSELLGSPGMRALIADSKELFDVVLFDSPPLLAVTDAAVLSTMVDGTVVVVRMGSTAREAVKRAIMQLRTVHGRVLGAVLNDVDYNSGSYYGGYGYYYYAYYGDGNGNGRKNTVIDRVKRFAGRAGRPQG